jgi:hypothetical protein
MRSEVRVCLDGIPRKEKAHTALQRAALLDHLGHYTSIRAQVLRRTHTAWRWIPVGAGMNGQIQAELKGVRMRRPNAWRISRRERVESHSTMPPLARATRSAASRVVPLAVSSHGEWDARAATHR